METIRRIIGAARGGLFRHIQPGRLLRAAMPEVFPVTAAAALLAAYGMPAGMGSLFGAGGSYALPVLGIAFLCAIWCAGMNIYPAFAGTVLGSLAGGRPQGAAAAMLILLCTFLQKKKKRLPVGMRYLYTAAVLTVLYPVFGTLTIQGAAGYFGGICVSVAAAVLMRHALGGIESILGRREVTDERIVTIALLAGVAVMAFGKFELFGISPGRWLQLFSVCWQHIRRVLRRFRARLRLRSGGLWAAAGILFLLQCFAAAHCSAAVCVFSENGE